MVYKVKASGVLAHSMEIKFYLRTFFIGCVTPFSFYKSKTNTDCCGLEALDDLELFQRRYVGRAGLVVRKEVDLSLIHIYCGFRGVEPTSSKVA